MTHPVSNPRPPKRFRSLTFVASTTDHVPWLKKTKHHPSTDHSSTPFHRLTPPPRPRLRSAPTFTLDTTTLHAHPLRTPQPPLLTIPHWTALRNRHRQTPLDPFCSSPPAPTVRTFSRKRLRHYTSPPL
jgi:hypothetical protein